MVKLTEAKAKAKAEKEAKAKEKSEKAKAKAKESIKNVEKEIDKVAEKVKEASSKSKNVSFTQLLKEQGVTEKVKEVADGIIEQTKQTTQKMVEITKDVEEKVKEVKEDVGEMKAKANTQENTDGKSFTQSLREQGLIVGSDAPKAEAPKSEEAPKDECKCETKETPKADAPKAAPAGGSFTQSLRAQGLIEGSDAPAAEAPKTEVEAKDEQECQEAENCDVCDKADDCDIKEAPAEKPSAKSADGENLTFPEYLRSQGLL